VGGVPREWPLLAIFLSVLLDASTTTLGLALGLGEAGPVASRIIYALGPLYWLLEAGALLGLYYVILRCTRLPPGPASAVVILGPWVAGWHNAGLIARVVLGG
jgi:hypothetical protein